MTLAQAATVAACCSLDLHRAAAASRTTRTCVAPVAYARDEHTRFGLAR